MNPDFSLITLTRQASIPVQLVMLTLLFASLVSWAVIAHKTQHLRRANKLNRWFEHQFWSGLPLQDLMAQATQNLRDIGPLERIFVDGLSELHKFHERQIQESRLLEATHRAMRASLEREMNVLESHLGLLATIGSISPYVGLFGTVWGIMHAFLALGAAQQVTIATVAPAIAEALITTAMGLLTAIPAVIWFNHLSNQVNLLASQQERFIDELTNVLQRNLQATIGSQV
jgi:biopolymer transport protein TolQ